MKKVILIVCFGCYSCISLAQDHDWLFNAWFDPVKKIGESWEKNHDFGEGIGYQIKQGDSTVTEFIQLVSSGGGIDFEAKVAGQNDVVRFGQKERTNNLFCFENPAHDFPQFIRYEYLPEPKTLYASVGTRQKVIRLYYINRKTHQDNFLHHQVNISASAEQIFQRMTTLSGITQFFAPDARIELKRGGAYEIYFNAEANDGEKGCEGCKILFFEPGSVLSFTWNAPPSFPSVRQEKTWVIVEFKPDNENPQHTIVHLLHLGWGKGEIWNQVYAYFDKAWPYVLNNLKKSFGE